MSEMKQIPTITGHPAECIPAITGHIANGAVQLTFGNLRREVALDIFREFYEAVDIGRAGALQTKLDIALAGRTSARNKLADVTEDAAADAQLAELRRVKLRVSRERVSTLEADVLAQAAIIEAYRAAARESARILE